MSDRYELTLPGDIPGLLRRCSPAIRVPHRSFAMTIGAFEDGWAYGTRPDCGACSARVRELALDLTDATGRAHAAWWLAERLGRAPTHGPASWESWPGFWSLSWQDTDRDRRHEVGCTDIVEGMEDVSSALTVPTLADLDTGDLRTLADGSLWADAEALRRVVLHVARRGATDDDGRDPAGGPPEGRARGEVGGSPATPTPEETT